MNQITKDFEPMQDYLHLLNNMSPSEKVEYQKQKRKYTEEQIELLRKMSSQNEVYKFMSWIADQKDYVIDQRVQPYAEFVFVRTNLSLITQIALSSNSNPMVNSYIPFNKYPFTLDLIRILAYQSNTGEGARFINSLVSMSHSAKLPIVLYCNDEMVSYYGKWKFQNKGYNYEHKNRMILYP